MEPERIEVTAADLRGPVERADGTIEPGSTVEIEGRRYRVVSYTAKPTGYLDIAFKEVGGSEGVLHSPGVLPRSKYVVLRDRRADGV